MNREWYGLGVRSRFLISSFYLCLNHLGVIHGQPRVKKKEKIFYRSHWSNRSSFSSSSRLSWVFESTYTTPTEVLGPVDWFRFPKRHYVSSRYRGFWSGCDSREILSPPSKSLQRDRRHWTTLMRRLTRFVEGDTQRCSHWGTHWNSFSEWGRHRTTK